MAELFNLIISASRRTCHIDWEPVEIQNAETLSAFLKRDEYIENEKLLWNLYDIEVFFRIKRILSKTFLKKTQYP